MVKHEIMEQKKGKEQTLFWFLKLDGGDLVLGCSDPQGDGWNVLRITTNGRLVRQDYIPPDIGLDLDEERRIKEE